MAVKAPSPKQSGVFGVCHHSPAEVVAVMTDAIARKSIYVACSGEPIPRRRAYVVSGIGELKTLAPVLRRAHATIVVCDSFPNLQSIGGITILDAVADTSGVSRWSPVRMDTRPLKSHLRRLRPGLPTIEFSNVDVVSVMIADVRSHGILDKVLTLSHKIPNREARSAVLKTTHEFLYGKIGVRTVENRLRPAREGTQTWKAYRALVDSLQSPYGRRLAKAVRTAHPKYDPSILQSLADKNKVDVFELRYLSHSSKKDKKHA